MGGSALEATTLWIGINEWRLLAEMTISPQCFRLPRHGLDAAGCGRDLLILSQSR
jgi:hypothetical protein